MYHLADHDFMSSLCPCFLRATLALLRCTRTPTTFGEVVACVSALPRYTYIVQQARNSASLRKATYAKMQWGRHSAGGFFLLAHTKLCSIDRWTRKMLSINPTSSASTFRALVSIAPKKRVIAQQSGIWQAPESVAVDQDLQSTGSSVAGVVRFRKPVKGTISCWRCRPAWQDNMHEIVGSNRSRRMPDLSGPLLRAYRPGPLVIDLQQEHTSTGRVL